MLVDFFKKEKEYFDLLLNFCLKTNKILFISYDKVCEEAINRLITFAKSCGIEEIYTDVKDAKEEANILLNIDEANIGSHPYFNMSVWNDYAQKGAAFLIIKTDIPHVYDGVDESKLVTAAKIKRNSQMLYKKLQLSYQISWCIGVLPNEVWAKNLYPDAVDSFYNFYNDILSACMIDGKENATIKWREQIDKNSRLASKLNDLNIKSLHYRADNGTNLKFNLDSDAKWMGADKGNMVVNMPTYEVYTFTDCNSIDGIDCSTRPLHYNGTIIEDFVVTFSKGKVVSVRAKKGEDALRCLVSCASGSDTLGEVAIVDNDSPVARLNKNFGITLLDENAACHFAFGNAYPATLRCYSKCDELELKKHGFNTSDIHVDFMVGYKGLSIDAECQEGVVEIVKNGRIMI